MPRPAKPFVHQEVEKLYAEGRKRTPHVGRVEAPSRHHAQQHQGVPWAHAQRYVLYAVACASGFRAAAMASLTPESFALDANPSTVALAARKNKNRKARVQPLPDEVAALLRDFMQGKPAGQPLWGGAWASDHRARRCCAGTWSRLVSPTSFMTLMDHHYTRTSMPCGTRT